jgi:hypothetical protein
MLPSRRRAWLRQAQRIPSPTGPLEGPDLGPVSALARPGVWTLVDMLPNSVLFAAATSCDRGFRERQTSRRLLFANRQESHAGG